MKPLKVNPEYRALVPRPTNEEYEALERDIIEKQCATEPIKINKKDEILDGHTRFEICTKHALYFDTQVVDLPSVLDEKIYIIEINQYRRNLTPFQRVELNAKLGELYSEKAKLKLSEAGKLGRDIQLGVVQDFTTPEPVDVGEILAKKIGFSRRTYFKAKTITEEGTEEEKNKARSGRETISKVYNKIKRRQKLEEAKAAGSPPLPEGRYDIIYADPPWRYGYEGSDRGKADNHYATMPTQDICDLPVQDLTAENALLFLWSTNPMLEDALKVAHSWGFRYITNFAWVKDKMGLGFWLRNKHELLLVCEKGSMPHPADADRYPSVIEAPRGEHSVKPAIVYDMVDSMYPNRKKIELFARTSHEGWIGWGLECK